MNSLSFAAAYRVTSQSYRLFNDLQSLSGRPGICFMLDESAGDYATPLPLKGDLFTGKEADLINGKYDSKQPPLVSYIEMHQARARIIKTTPVTEVTADSLEDLDSQLGTTLKAELTELEE